MGNNCSPNFEEIQSLELEVIQDNNKKKETDKQERANNFCRTFIGNLRKLNIDKNH